MAPPFPPLPPLGPVADSVEGDEIAWLRRAVELGRRGWGQVAPNPMVGCVIVREGQVVGEGWHKVYGGPHAEVVALQEAGDRARGATAIVSLEPCRHEGKTPPCTRALLAAGVSRVVYGAADPGVDSGGGGAELAAAGVEVAGPLLTAEAGARENPAFFHRAPDRPWLELKLALSLDGKIGEGEGVRTLLSGEEATGEVHRLRAGFDAILIGSKTARVDDPSLTVRGDVTPRMAPRRVVVDSGGGLDPEGKLFREEGGQVIVLTTERAPLPWRSAIEGAGGRLFLLPQGTDGRVELRAALRLLRSEGVRSVFCEGGGILGSALLLAGLVDRLHLVITPRFLGGAGTPGFVFPENAGTIPAGRWSPLGEPRRYGEDLWASFERGSD